MDSDDEMLDVQAIPTAAKGKGKAFDKDRPFENENLPWVEKYRPVTLDDVVSHKDITTTIEKFIEKNRLPHLLFYGPPGTGKTSTILAVARRIYGSEYRKQILELNASDDRGIDVVREQIKQFAETRTLFSKGYKLIILDEADMMTQQAQAALRRVIEQYTKNVRFCIICNYVNKIAPAIQSRCTRFRFSPLPIVEVEKRLDAVIEGRTVLEPVTPVKVTPDGKAALLKLSKGDMRRALNVLQACHAAYDLTGETEIYNCTGSPHPADIETIAAYDYIEALELKPHARIYLLDHLATTEHRLSTGASEKIQLTALLGAFKNAVELTLKS
ncbi:P-loop containing nucleoside triphosphate hydrolase protein [Mycena filopes]|nr:P-loop containing nucleoside triphosphate hydrolase protein [Mycena filopes]